MVADHDFVRGMLLSRDKSSADGRRFAENMMNKSLHEIIPVLQLAIIPVILISGVGLLLLTLTNRFGRVCERVRTLAFRLQRTRDGRNTRLQSQIFPLYQRARYLRAAVTLASVSVLLDTTLVIVLFGAALFEFEVAPIISAVFMVSMLALAGSTIAFLFDLNLSLVALRLDLDCSLQGGPSPAQHCGDALRSAQPGDMQVAVKGKENLDERRVGA